MDWRRHLVGYHGHAFSGWLSKILKFPMQLKPGLYQSGSFHPASQTKLGLPPAVRMLYWLPPSISAKTKKQQTSNKGRWVLRSGRGQLRETRSTSAAPPAIGRSTFPRQQRPKDLSIFNVTFTSSRSSTMRTLDCRSSWAPRRNSIKASAPSFKEPLLLSTPSFGEWVAPSTTITRWSLLRSWVLILKS